MANSLDCSGANNNNYKGHMHRKCSQCKGPINGSSATRKFCSRECQAASYRKPENHKNCNWCGKAFYHRSTKHCSIECAVLFKASTAKNPGEKKRRAERKESGLFTGLIGRPKGVRYPAVCQTCAKGFMVRPSETDKKFCSTKCYGVEVGRRQSGEKHHMYIDGKSKERGSQRQELRRHKGYTDWKLSVFTRDEYTCRACSTKGGSLEAHHHVAWVDNPKLRLKVSNGITLCKECHRLWHAYDRKGLFVGKESVLQTKVKLALEEYGFYVFNVPGTPLGVNGVPDLLVSFNGFFGGLECKVFPNYLSENQKRQSEKIIAAGGVFRVIQSEDDIGRVIEAFETKTSVGGWCNNAQDDVKQLEGIFL